MMYFIKSGKQVPKSLVFIKKTGPKSSVRQNDARDSNGPNLVSRDIFCHAPNTSHQLHLSLSLHHN